MKKKKRETKTLSSLFDLTNTYHSSVLDLINLITFTCYSLVYHLVPFTISRLFFDNPNNFTPKNNISKLDNRPSQKTENILNPSFYFISHSILVIHCCITHHPKMLSV